MRNRVTRLIGGSLLAIICLSGCLDGKSMGLGRRPLIPYVPALAFSAPEVAQLTAWSKANPDLFSRLQKHSNTQADLIRKYNQEALKVNAAQLKVLSYEDDEIRSTLYAGLRRIGFPADSELCRDYAPKTE